MSLAVWLGGVALGGCGLVLDFRPKADASVEADAGLDAGSDGALDSGSDAAIVDRCQEFTVADAAGFEQTLWVCTPRTYTEAKEKCALYAADSGLDYRLVQPRAGERGSLEELYTQLQSEADYLDGSEGFWVGLEVPEALRASFDSVQQDATLSLEQRNFALAHLFYWLDDDSRQPALFEWEREEPNGVLGEPEYCGSLAIDAEGVQRLNDLNCEHLATVVCEPVPDEDPCWDTEFVCDAIDDDCDGVTDDLPTGWPWGEEPTCDDADGWAECLSFTLEEGDDTDRYLMCPPLDFDRAAWVCAGFGMRLVETRSELAEDASVSLRIAQAAAPALMSLHEDRSYDLTGIWTGARVPPDVEDDALSAIIAERYLWLSDGSVVDPDGWSTAEDGSAEPSRPRGCRMIPALLEEDLAGASALRAVSNDCGEDRFFICQPRYPLALSAP